jgi:RsiW-degrading membrane proteinase PrsW (M82 family)
MLAAHSLSLTVEGWVSGDSHITAGEPAKLFDAFILSALTEELCKWVLLVAAVYRWREFNEPLDGLLYGVALALGFATLENFYFLNRLGLAIAWQRAVLAVPAHALFGGAMGYYVGRAKFGPKFLRTRNPRRLFDAGLSLVVPSLFHGAYDYALHHRISWKMWAAVTILSLGFWGFVLRRVYRAQRSSPYRPKTMPPPGVLK